MVLNGINIRSGLELDVPVSDIFNVNIAPDGNILAKHCFLPDGSIKREFVDEVNSILANDQIITYTDLKIPQRINDTLTCYVFDSYFVYNDELVSGKIETEKNVELIFINSEVLDYERFCSNLMAAQAFSGNFDKPQFNHHFMGVGSFGFEEYVSLHNLVAHSNINLINFFIYYKKVLSSIGYFVCGLYENDVKDQKKYLTDQEYKNLMSIAKKRKRELMDSFKKIADSELDSFF